jgi:Tol biopolymer transport system component
MQTARPTRAASLASTLLLLAPTALAGGGGGGSTTRVSVHSDGTEGNATSRFAAISGNSRYVVFHSSATNLVAGDANGTSDIFRHDLKKSKTILVTLDSGGLQANGPSTDPAVSGNGRWVTFESTATNLVAGDLGGKKDIFLRDESNDVTIRASVNSIGIEANEHSHEPDVGDNGRRIVFETRATNLDVTDTNTTNDIYLFEKGSGTTTRVSLAHDGSQLTGDSSFAALSDDGRFVTWINTHPGAVPGKLSNRTDVFVREIDTGVMERASVGLGGADGDGNCNQPSLSADGRFVCFQSDSTNLVPGDTNGAYDVFVRDRLNGTTQRVSLAWDGSEANGSSSSADISADGRQVCFEALASNLVLGDVNGIKDVFVRDCVAATTSLVSVTTGGGVGTGVSLCYRAASMSPDGRYVAFMSYESTLVANDTNGVEDVFVRDCWDGSPASYGFPQTNSLGCFPAIDSTGTASATAGSGFFVTASQILNQRSGLLFYSKSGPNLTSFSGGTMWVKTPTTRTPLQNAGGTALPTNDCTGAFSYDFNLRIASGVDPALVVGQDVWAQYWSRDAQAVKTTNLTDALRFRIGP